MKIRKGHKQKKVNTQENIHRTSKSRINKGNEFTGTLSKPTQMSEQLSIMKILSALVLCLFFKSL